MSKGVSMTKLREALEASYSKEIAYANAYQEGNPMLGNCYPSARVVQHFYPDTEIAKGIVWTGTSEEIHFWNILSVDGQEYHIDFTWAQFPYGSVIKSYEILDRDNLGDSQGTLDRVDLLLIRVKKYLSIT